MSELNSDHHSKNRTAIFLRGGTAVGKTTIAKMLSKKLHPSVHIEQDNLRYMIVNGLVASYTGLPPGDYPEEYRRQCKLADKNTIDLVRNFTENGFICVVDGFNGGESGDTFYFLENPNKIEWYPKKEYFIQELSLVNIYQIVLDVDEEALEKRLREIKLWNYEVIQFILEQRKIFLSSIDYSEIDLLIKTEEENPKDIVARILQELNL